MNYEKIRLRTFTQFPNEYMDIKMLAKYGFYYIGQNETCRCYFCGAEINDWEIFMNPLTEHWKQSTNCPILTNMFTNNIPYNLK